VAVVLAVHHPLQVPLRALLPHHQVRAVALRHLVVHQAQVVVLARQVVLRLARAVHQVQVRPQVVALVAPALLAHLHLVVAVVVVVQCVHVQWQMEDICVAQVLVLPQ